MDKGRKNKVVQRSCDLCVTVKSKVQKKNTVLQIPLDFLQLGKMSKLLVANSIVSA